MITSKQIAAGRALLGISQAVLAQWAGLSRATVSGMEADYDCKASSLRAITEALQTRGIRFTPTGGIEQVMEWSGDPPPPEIRKRVLSGLNEARRATHRPPLIDGEKP
jgi:DNA-binding XRE family transcriptional regulator